ncbi:MAG TPA: Gfo/Idh/MocA family oxidoreductase [Roseiflexaceae bacterium]|nr:Gfo/Idh/MocA family oxidoreductase [Roseiflexaceae bacterium]
MQPIRLGVIGAGLIWQRAHKNILETLTDTFQPIAFCDLSEERRAAAAQAFPNATVLNDADALLALPDVDAVLVLTPLALNAPTARAALIAGKDVIMEKPIARSVAEGQELADTARRQGKRLVVTEQMGYRQAEDTLAELLGGGAIGDVVLWERVQHLEADSAKGALRYDTTPWRKQADFPLGTMFDGGIHLIAGLTKVFGTPQNVAASGRKLRQEYGEYDHIAALFEYANGARGMLSYSNYLLPVQNHFHIYGTAGMLTVERDRIVVAVPDQPDRIVETPVEHAYAVMWQAIAAAFRERHMPFYTPEKALQDVAILEAVDQAIKTGGRASVEVVDRTV